MYACQRDNKDDRWIVNKIKVSGKIHKITIKQAVDMIASVFEKNINQ